MKIDIPRTAVEHLQGQIALLHEDAGGLLVGVTSVFQFQFCHDLHLFFSVWDFGGGVGLLSVLVEDDGLTLPGGQVDILHKQGHLVVLVEAAPYLTRPGSLALGGGDGHPAGLPFKGREGLGILLVGVDEVALPSLGSVVLIEVAVAAGGVTVQATSGWTGSRSRPGFTTPEMRGV